MLNEKPGAVNETELGGGCMRDWQGEGNEGEKEVSHMPAFVITTLSWCVVGCGGPK